MKITEAEKLLKEKLRKILALGYLMFVIKRIQVSRTELMSQALHNFLSLKLLRTVL